MDDSGPRLPELDSVLLGRALEKVKYLLVGNKSTLWLKSEEFCGLQGNMVTSRSACAPLDAWIRWSQCMLTGTAHRERPALMNCNLLIPVGELKRHLHQGGGFTEPFWEIFTDQ